MRRFRQTWLTLAAFFTAVGAAQATTVTLDQCAVAELCSQVTITTTLSGNTIDVDVIDVPGAPNSGLFGKTGANRAFGFNVVDPDLGVVISDVTSGFSYAGDGVTQMGGGFGDFEFIINGPQSGSAAFLPLHFNVSRASGFLSDLGLFEPNALGYVFAAHIRNNDNGVSGFVSAFPPVIPQDPDGGEFPSDSVPEPATLVLFGLGLAALARRMRQPRPTARPTATDTAA